MLDSQSNNWFEAVSTFEVTYPRRDITYPAELQGCCRQQSMRLDTSGAPQFADGVGILELASTRYTVRVFVRLNDDPPPISFLPSFLPFSTEGGVSRMDLPIIDFTATYLVNDPAAAAAQPEPWSDQVIQDSKDAAGYLSLTESRPAVGRRLMQSASSASTQSTLNNLPVTPLPLPVYATMSGQGNDVRMLPHSSALNPALLLVYPTPSCSGTSVYMAPGMDACENSPVQRYHDGGKVAGNISSVLVPPGLHLALTDGCEYSQPVNALGAFDYGNILAQVDNSAGATALCLAAPPGAHGRMLRVLAPPARSRSAGCQNACKARRQGGSTHQSRQSTRRRLHRRRRRRRR